MLVYIGLSLNNRIRRKEFRNESLETNNAKDSERVVCTFGETHAISAMTSSTLQDTRHRDQKWTVGPKHRKERETFCGCLGKRTPFLRLRVQLYRIRDIATRNGPLDRNNVSGLEDRADVSGNARHFCDDEFNSTR